MASRRRHVTREEHARIVAEPADGVTIGVGRYRDDLDALHGQGALASRDLDHARARLGS